MSRMTAVERWREDRSRRRAQRRNDRNRQDDNAVLEAIRGGAHYGLDISRAAGIRPGRLYPCIDRLEDAGLISATWDQPTSPGGLRRRRYSA